MDSNPLTASHRDGLTKAVKMIPRIREEINRAKAVGMDMSDRERHLNDAEIAAVALLNNYFPGWDK